MKSLNFEKLHKEKMNLIFENIQILEGIKESDTTLPASFFGTINKDTIMDYSAKMSILNKNTRFCVRQLKKDFRLLRKEQRAKLKLLRKQRKSKSLEIKKKNN